MLEQAERELTLVEQPVVLPEARRDDLRGEEREPCARLVAVEQLDAVDPDRALVRDGLTLPVRVDRRQREQAGTDRRRVIAVLAGVLREASIAATVSRTSASSSGSSCWTR